MPRPYEKRSSEVTRVAPGTAVTWYDGFVLRRGRVKHNLPNGSSKGPMLIVSTSTGEKVTVPARKVTIVGDQS